MQQNDKMHLSWNFNYQIVVCNVFKYHIIIGLGWWSGCAQTAFTVWDCTVWNIVGYGLEYLV